MAISSSLGEQHEVDLPQGRVRYRERGSGPPLVFIHGVLVNGDLWRKVVPALADDHRCLSPDLPLGAHEPAMHPGADLSPVGLADLIRDFLDATGVERATLVGNDTGGALVQVFAGRHPERAGRVVLTNCDTREHFPPTRWLKSLVWLAGRVPGMVWETAQAMRSRRLRQLVVSQFIADRDAIDDELWRSYLRPLRSSRAVRRDVAKVLRGMHKRYTLAAAEQLAASRVPVLLAWGTEDRVFPPSHAERLAADLPGATLRPIPGASTFVAEDRPAELADLIREFAGAARRAQPVG